MKPSVCRHLLRIIPLLLVLVIAGCGEIDWFPPYVREPTTPDQFSFQPKTGTDLNVDVTSEAITVKGLTAASSPISISGATDSKYSINGGTATSSPGTVKNEDTVTVTHKSSDKPGTSTTSTLTIGGVSANFVSTTKIVGSFTGQSRVGSFYQAYADISSVDGIAAFHTISITDTKNSGSAVFAITEPNVIDPDSTVQFVSSQTLSFTRKRIFVRNLSAIVDQPATTNLTVDGVAMEVKLTTP